MRDFALGPWELVIILFIASVWLVPFWRIFAKAGYAGALSLLMVVPVVNVALLYFLAFTEWPIFKRHTP